MEVTPAALAAERQEERIFSSHPESRRSYPLALQPNPCFSLISLNSTVAMTQGTITVARDLCKGCELCVAACPQACIRVSSSFNTRGYRFAELQMDGACTGCAACALVCPDSAITVLRESRKPRAA